MENGHTTFDEIEKHGVKIRRHEIDAEIKQSLIDGADEKELREKFSLSENAAQGLVQRYKKKYGGAKYSERILQAFHLIKDKLNEALPHEPSSLRFLSFQSQDIDGYDLAILMGHSTIIDKNRFRCKYSEKRNLTIGEAKWFAISLGVTLEELEVMPIPDLAARISNAVAEMKAAPDKKRWLESKRDTQAVKIASASMNKHARAIAERKAKEAERAAERAEAKLADEKRREKLADEKQLNATKLADDKAKRAAERAEAGRMATVQRRAEVKKRCVVLREVMKKAGITATQLSVLSGINRFLLHSRIYGETACKPHELEAIAKSLNVAVDLFTNPIPVADPSHTSIPVAEAAHAECR